MPEKNKKKPGIAAIRTLKTDTSAYIKREGVSMLDIAAAEAKRGRSRDSAAVRPGRTRKIILLALIFALAAGAAVTAGYLSLKGRRVERGPVAVFPPPPIVPDGEMPVSLADASAVSRADVPRNKFFYFPIVVEAGGIKRLASAGEFFGALGVKPPVGLIESLEGGFMLGVFRLSRKSPVLVFKVRSYENAFASMLKWEKNIAYDLAEIMDINAAGSLKTSFYDKEIKNRDARELEGEDGEPALLYSFINRKYLVITTSEEALAEIFRRFTVSKYLNQ